RARRLRRLTPPSRMEVRSGGLDTPQVGALLSAHIEDMRRCSPPESVHDLDLDLVADATGPPDPA
ncbi:MAG TPA: hypothetical protein VLI66_09830, partial [Terrabacter sp.]|nr:hypothetical protein [Terrabacter sp.]